MKLQKDVFISFNLTYDKRNHISSNIHLDSAIVKYFREYEVVGLSINVAPIGFYLLLSRVPNEISIHPRLELCSFYLGGL